MSAVERYNDGFVILLGIRNCGLFRDWPEKEEWEMSRGLWNTAAQFVERGYAAKAP